MTSRWSVCSAMTTAGPAAPTALAAEVARAKRAASLARAASSNSSSSSAEGGICGGACFMLRANNPKPRKVPTTGLLAALTSSMATSALKEPAKAELELRRASHASADIGTAFSVAEAAIGAIATSEVGVEAATATGGNGGGNTSPLTSAGGSFSLSCESASLGGNVRISVRHRPAKRGTLPSSRSQLCDRTASGVVAAETSRETVLRRRLASREELWLCRRRAALRPRTKGGVTPWTQAVPTRPTSLSRGPARPSLDGLLGPLASGRAEPTQGKGAGAKVALSLLEAAVLLAERTLL
mmetsp:Transcript_978/g.2036  ORF Transcript_978/g.2036 Transcript_978/m.2036 type:complete len:298 (-) Transcript_978:140-1033(-)